jgi:hypothetical protein
MAPNNFTVISSGVVMKTLIKEFTCCAHSSVAIALSYRLDDRVYKVRFLAGAGNFSLHHRVQYDSGAHPASYPMGSRGSFPGGKAAGA